MCYNVTNEVREYYLYDHLIIPAKYFLSANRWEGRNDGIHKSTKSWKQSWSRIRGSPLAKVKKYGYVMLTSGPSNFNPGWMDCKITGLRDFGISFVFSFIFWWMFRILWDRGFCCNYWLVLVCYQSSSLVTEKLFEAPGMRAPPYEEPGCPNPVTRVSDIIGWRLDLIIINKLRPPACAAQHVYYCGNRNGWDTHWYCMHDFSELMFSNEISIYLCSDPNS